MIYKNLYSKDNDKINIIEFIEITSKEIFSKDSVYNKDLRSYELIYDELNVNINKITDNTKSFFGKELQNKFSDFSILVEFLKI